MFPAPVAQNGTCEACADADPEKPLWDPMTRSCARVCPAGLGSRRGLCSTCAVAHLSEPENERASLYDPGSDTCVRACPESAPAADENGVCRTCGAILGKNSGFWDQREGKCAETCPYGRQVRENVCLACN